MSYDKTFCAAKCVNALCPDNRIHAAKAPKGLPLSWYDPSKDCVSFEATDTYFIDGLPVEVLAEKANKAEGLSWELGEAFHELSFKVVGRLQELNGRKLTQGQRTAIEAIMVRLRLRLDGLPWVKAWQ